MARRARASVPPVPAPLPLRVNDLLFINEYFRNGQNATQAYRVVHPTAKYSTAEVNGFRQLRKTSVQAELARRTRYEIGVTKEWGQTRLLDYEAMAYAKADYLGGASICMDAMRLGGHLVERRHVETVSEASSAAIADLVAACLPRRIPAAPTVAASSASPLLSASESPTVATG